jgi:hypothetical protein
MDQMAENTPEVEIETDASEQIPDDVELAEEVETEDGSESSGNDAEEATETDDDESEQEFYFGDEKLDSPTSEDSAEHGLVKHLRKTIKEKDRELKELMRQSQKPVEQQPVITQPPRMPKLDDENITCSLHCCITGTEFFSVTGNYAGGLKAFNVVFEHDFKVFC